MRNRFAPMRCNRPSNCWSMKIVLLAAQGLQNKENATRLGVGRVQVARWRERYASARRACIERDLPRGAPPATVNVARLVELTTQSTPEAATTAYTPATRESERSGSD